MTPTSRLFGLAAAALALAACGSNTRVALELTDAPPDTTTIEHAFVTLSRVEVHVAGDDDEAKGGTESAKNGNNDEASVAAGGQGDADGTAEDGGWRTVTPAAGTFDLMALRNDVVATLGELDLPSGKITQIRLFIDAAGRNEVVLASGQTCPLDLSSVPPTGVKINHPFKALDVQESPKLRIVVDFDLDESLAQSGACSFALKPVIKIKRVEKS
jgi:hypothetical protein